MARHGESIRGPRKRRTRQHVIADLGVHHVEGRILEAGYTFQRVDFDYGYDLIVFTYDGAGYVEPGFGLILVKASESLIEMGPTYVLDVSVRDYNLWMLERVPVFLVLFDASRRKAYWVPFQTYFTDHAERRPRTGAKTLRVRVPKKSIFGPRAIAKMRQLIAESPRKRIGGEP